MQDLLNIDIITVNCTNSKAGLAAIKHCQKFFNFGRSIFIGNDEIRDSKVESVVIPKLNSVDEYNNFILKLNKYSSNDFVLIVQDDGFIINPNKWDGEYLKYDYIGAPWSSHKDNSWISLQRPSLQPYFYSALPENRVGNGGFSLRSRKFLEYSSQFDSCEGFGEDAFLNIVNFKKAKNYGILYPPFELALKFSYENPFYPGGEIRNSNLDYFEPDNHFGFHGYNFLNSHQLINSKFNQ